MGKSAPLFKDIIIRNQLVKGRLQLPHSDLETLYHSMQRKESRFRKNLEKHQENIKSHKLQINELKYQLRRNSETLQKAFHPTTDNISLLYKKLGNAYYIKARLYWNGKQREVQIGSVSIIIDMINNMISRGILLDLKTVKTEKLTWNIIKNKPRLVEAIKEIASLKFQEYIIRQLLASKVKKQDLNICNIDEINQSQSVKEDREKASVENTKAEFDENLQDGKVDWYVQWRRDNL